MATEPLQHTIAFVDHEEAFIAETIECVENLSTLDDRKRVGVYFRLVLVVVQPTPSNNLVERAADAIAKQCSGQGYYFRRPGVRIGRH